MLKKRSADNLFQSLATLLDVKGIHPSPAGTVIDGRWGRKMPLRDLADGYKSSFLWLTDFVGWALSRDPRLSATEDIAGIVLIDEIEQHLHPRWQEQVVARLQHHFPRVQFIATTHSPLIAASVGEVGRRRRDDLVDLRLMPGNKVVAERLPTLRGMRVDQVLASRAFDYLVTTDSEVNEALRRASRLAGKRRRSGKEETEYKGLKELIVRSLVLKAESPVERMLESEFLAFMKKKTAHLEDELFGDQDD